VAVTCVAYEAEGWGVGELWWAEGRLLWHELPRPLPAGPPRASTRFQPNGKRVAGGKLDRVGSVTISELVERLRAHLGGWPSAFDDVELELEWCTPFQRAAVEALRRIPPGQTVTYGELAALAGRPNAQRAAGTFCAQNRFGLIVPCHRVVAAAGPGSYGSLGVAYKRRLLELEGAL
jgi:methylated-DNA-[protein]-cysteine S-methyltransferase